MNTHYLKQQFHHAAELARLQAAEWGHLYRDWNAEVALKDFAAERADGGLPTTLVALEGSQLLGSVSLIFNDLPGAEDLNPWLASMYVLAGHRGKGVGSFLLADAMKVLRGNGVSTVYLFTESAEGFFRRHSWARLRAAAANGRAVTIMVRRV